MREEETIRAFKGNWKKKRISTEHKKVIYDEIMIVTNMGVQGL